jgi:hypothetical protein
MKARRVRAVDTEHLAPVPVLAHDPMQRPDALGLWRAARESLNIASPEFEQGL